MKIKNNSQKMLHLKTRAGACQIFRFPFLYISVIVLKVIHLKKTPMTLFHYALCDGVKNT